MLQYDDSAFGFFALSIISCYVIPSWCCILSRFYRVFVIDKNIGALARTEVEKSKMESFQKEYGGFRAFRSKCYIIFMITTLALTILLGYLAFTVSVHSEISGFDPFLILGIDRSSTVKEIKNAYRLLAKKYHPDQNRDDRSAAAHFITIKMAYDVLTNEEARQNWMDTGRPDGQNSFEGGMGLPSFLLETSNRNLVLLVYLITLVGLIPYFTYKYYANSSKFGDKNVMYDSYTWFHHNLTEHTPIKALPEILAGAAEFRRRNQPKTKEECLAIAKQMATIKSKILKSKFNHPVCVKGSVLLHSYLLRKTDTLSQENREDLRNMLRHMDPLVEAMISVCKHSDALQTAIQCINFQQYMTQAMWFKDSHLLQLPYYTTEEAQGETVTTIQEFRKVVDEDHEKLKGMAETQQKDIHDCLKLIPELEVSAQVFVNDDEDEQVYEGDICTIRLSVRRHGNFGDHETRDLVHAPRFPFPKKEALWIILGQANTGKILSIEKVACSRDRIHHDIKLMAPPPGHYQFDLWVKSNGYIGVDQKLVVKLDCLDGSQLSEYVVHPDDAKLDDEPTLFEELMNGRVDSDVEDEDEPSVGSRNDATILKREQMRRVRQQVKEEDSDDEDE